jgi:hypothetical protein
MYNWRSLRHTSLSGRPSSPSRGWCLCTRRLQSNCADTTQRQRLGYDALSDAWLISEQGGPLLIATCRSGSPDFCDFSPGGDAQPSPKWPLVFRRRLFSRFARSIRIVTAKFEKRGLSESGPRKLLNLTGREPRFAGRCVYRPRVKPARRGRKVEGGRALVPLPSALGGICKPATSARWPRNLDRFGHPGKSFPHWHSPSPYPFPFSSRRRFSSNAALINAKCVNACGKLPRCSPDGLNSSAKRPK